MGRGFFFVIEGPEGSGKTTQVELLRSYLTDKGYDVVCVQEPGGTEVGELLRGILKRPGLSLGSKTELLLFVASRAQLVEEVIRPSIEEGKVVISDRFTLSTEVYQGYVAGLGVDFVRNLNRFCTDGLEPDITFVLLLSPKEAFRKRLGVKPSDSSQCFLFSETQPDRIERKEFDFHKKVYEGYRKVSRRRKNTVLINAKSSREDVYRSIVDVVERVLQRHNRSG